MGLILVVSPVVENVELLFTIRIRRKKKRNLMITVVPILNNIASILGKDTKQINGKSTCVNMWHNGLRLIRAKRAIGPSAVAVVKKNVRQVGNAQIYNSRPALIIMGGDAGYVKSPMKLLTM